MKKTLLFLLCIVGLSSISVAQNTIDKKAIKKLKLENGIYSVMSTSKGDILLKLNTEKTPLTVANFVGLAEGNFTNGDHVFTTPFYDGLVFHRVIANFMVQGGDPKGNGSGDPGYKFADEFDASLKHDGPGVLSMANSGPATNGSQFFITHKETPWLNGKHTIFGKVLVGQDIVDTIAQGDTLKKVSIYRIGKEAQNFDATAIFSAETIAIEIAAKEKKAQEKIANEKREKEIAIRKAMTKPEAIANFKTKMLEKYPTAVQTAGGLMYVMDEKGAGENVKPGQEVTVHYSGYLTDGKKFDSSIDRGQPLVFSCGTGRVIKGWDEGLLLLSKGSKCKLIIPYWLGYGENGGGPIPPYACLIFDVEMIDFKSVDVDPHAGHGHGK